MRGLDSHLFEVLIFHHNITAALVFESFYDLVCWNFLGVCFRHLLISDRTKIAGTKLPEAELLLAGGWVNGNRDVNQAEADAAFPDGTHTRECFPTVVCLSTSDPSSKIG